MLRSARWVKPHSNGARIGAKWQHYRLPPAEDPAETFARSFPLTGRLFRRWPQESRVLLNVGTELIRSDRG